MQDNRAQDVVDGAEGADVEVDPDNHADVAEEFAEGAGIDPTPHEVEEYLSLQEPDAPPA